ncbi:MAG TPA: 3'-5' exonuclease, partial [Burkholderiaceae bacterium]
AGEIARLLGAARRGEVAHDGRPLAAGDIAVLVRSHAHGAAMRAALAGVGVGSVELSQASIYDSPDAEEVERVLLAVLEPTREPLLRAALATEAMGFDATAIEALAADESALLALVERFADYRGAWLARGIGPMLRRWMAGEGVAPRLLARADGERRLTNLLHLAECLQEAAERHAAPEALLRWLQAERRARRGDDAVQLRLESDRHLVQIVTVHRAKGLEYPIVFCPFLCDGHPGGAANGIEGREYHDDDGRPVIDFRPEADGDAIKERIRLERAAEQLRLVYVALTRAVQRCYLVVGGYAVGKSVAESGRSLLNWLVAGDGIDPARWGKVDAPSPERIDAAWRAFAERSGGAVGLAPLPDDGAEPLPPQRPGADTIAALPAPRVPPGWWIGSYSSLAQGVRHEAAALDHDLRLAPVPADPRPAVERDDILRFPRGARAGECLHAVFEHADFAERASWPGAIATALRAHPQGAATDAALRPRMLERMLDDVLHTPLPGGVLLHSVPRARRLVELEFHLPASRLGAGALAAVLREHGYPVPPLAFGTLEGYLRGFIDLVFEHGGRFHVVDWKSNHLGDTAADYAAAPLAQAMAEHGYHLQALLYAVALHRHLQHRLPGYRYDEHFGSVLYLFVRGVRPGWRQPDGAPCGVHALRPSQQAIERLSSLFDAAQAVA